MNIQKISNNYNQPQFTARFPKADLQNIINKVESFKTKQPEIVPTTYTCLEYLDSILPGQKLRLINYGRGCELRANDKLLGVSSGVLSAIRNACVKDDEQVIARNYMRMPQSVFENEWWKNRFVKAEDIEKFALDIEA